MNKGYYTVDEFLRNTEEDSKKININKKISLLYDFCILKGTRRFPDKREDAVRSFLAQYETERQMTIALHDVLLGDVELNAVLIKAGVM